MCCFKFICILYFFCIIANSLYLRFLVFVQALHFYFSVVISNSFNFIFEIDLLCDSINYNFLKIMLSASPDASSPSHNICHHSNVCTAQISMYSNTIIK